MADAISVDLSGVVGASSGAAAGDAGGGSQIEVLKRKLVSLQKELSDVLKEQSKAAQQKAKLIELKIQLTQARIAQLEQQQAQRAAETQKQSKADSSLNSHAATVQKVSHPKLGNNVDELV